jgi:hypothetical protein
LGEVVGKSIVMHLQWFVYYAYLYI